jgi:hypothetical protein
VKILLDNMGKMGYSGKTARRVSVDGKADATEREPGGVMRAGLNHNGDSSGGEGGGNGRQPCGQVMEGTIQMIERAKQV